MIRAISWPIFTVLLLAQPVFASTYILTVAGLGGEPDYDQRFTLLGERHRQDPEEWLDRSRGRNA